MSLAMSGGGMAGGMVVPPSMMSGNAMATPNFMPPPQAPTHTHAASGACCGGGYDLSARLGAAASQNQEDTSACLGIYLGTTTYSAMVYVAGSGCITLTGREALPARLWVDPKTGALGISKWRKSQVGLPKGVEVHMKEGSPKNTSHISVPAGVRLIGLPKATHDVSIEASLYPAGLTIAPVEAEEEDFDSSRVRVGIPSEEASSSEQCEPEELLAILLSALRLKAQEGLGVRCVTCFISVPAHFGDQARVALQRAVYTAGLNAARFIAAPLASAVGALWDEQKGFKGGSSSGEGETVVSVRVGGSSLDVCLLEGCGKGKFEVVASSGRFRAGGVDMDFLIAKKLQAEIDAKHGAEIAQCPRTFAALVSAARRAREALSPAGSDTSIEEVQVSLPEGSFPSGPKVSYKRTLTRTQMEATVAPVLECLEEALQKVGSARGAASVRTVVLSGGCCSMVAVSSAVARVFPEGTKAKVGGAVAARGAAILLASQRELLSPEMSVSATDVVTMPILLQEWDGKTAKAKEEIFAAGTKLPATITRTYKASELESGGAALRLVVWQSGCGAVLEEEKEPQPVSDLGNPLRGENEKGYPMLLESITLDICVDECGIVTCLPAEPEVPVVQRKPVEEKSSRTFNIIAAVVIILALMIGGYLKLAEMAERPARDLADARERLIKFYSVVNPSKVAEIDSTLKNFVGRYPTLFKRLERKYGVAP